MLVLLTGATGFIGKKMVKALHESGHRVRILSRNPKRAHSLVERSTGVDCEAFSLESGNEGPSQEALQGVDAVIHLAGEPVARRWTSWRKRKIYNSRILSTRHLIDSLSKLKQKPHTFICASAVGYYGDRGNETLDESSASGSGFLAEVCIDWEHEAQRAEELGIRSAQVRTGLVLGPDGGALPQMLPAFRMGMGGRLGSGKQWMSWIHSQDLVRLILFVLENKALKGPVNGVSPHPTQNRSFTQLLGRSLGRPTWIPVPGIALKFAFGEMAEILLTGQKVIPKKALDQGFEFQHSDLEEALHSLLKKKSKLSANPQSPDSPSPDSQSPDSPSKDPQTSGESKT